jgi:hypothetical protein
MLSLLKSTSLIAVGALLAASLMQLAPSPAQSQSGASGCMNSRIQVPTINGLEWKRLQVCNDM